jgi:methionyl-tRNA formyltransferase
MFEIAEAHGLPIFEPDSVNSSDAQQALHALAPDLLVVCDYGQILSRETLSLARLGGINLHASLLPKYRGAAPINWAIYHGETETGVTVIHMTPRLDAGPCLVQRCTSIGPNEDAAKLESRLGELGVGTVDAAIAMLADWDGRIALGEVQNPALATKAPRLTKSDGEVNWFRTAKQIRDQIRALKPWPGTYTHWLRLEHPPVRMILDAASPVPLREPVPPGTVAYCDGQHLHVATGEDALSLERVQPAGKRIMEVAEFLRGHPIQAGQLFANPASS